MRNNVVTITNKEYLVGTLVMFYSLLKNGNVDRFDFHVMYEDDFDLAYLSSNLDEIASRFDADVDTYFSPIKFDSFGENTLEFYKKALAKFNVFALDLKSLLFLDSDLLILGDVSALFDLDCDFAACRDMGTPREFNTGVMHIGSKWLNDDSVDFLTKSSEKRFSHRGDQEHINDLVRHDLKVIPSTYNTLKDQHRFVGSWLSGVKILHYISKKPWKPFNPKIHKSGNLECLEIDKIWFKYFDELELDDIFLFKDRKELIQYVNELFPLGYGAEVGVQKGEFSKVILEEWNCSGLFLIDPWKDHPEYSSDVGAVSNNEHEENLKETLNNVKKYGDKVEIIRDFSINASEEFSDGGLDFVFLDARHDAEGIREDIEHWWPLVRKGGILAGHDYANYDEPKNLIEVKKVVDEVLIDVNVTLDGPFPSWWIKKT